MFTYDLESFSTWINAFFVLAGLGATLSVIAVAMALPRRADGPSQPGPGTPVEVRERVLEGAGAR